jgi:hypothetical protein
MRAQELSHRTLEEKLLSEAEAAKSERHREERERDEETPAELNAYKAPMLEALAEVIAGLRAWEPRVEVVQAQAAMCRQRALITDRAGKDGGMLLSRGWSEVAESFGNLSGAVRWAEQVREQLELITVRLWRERKVELQRATQRGLDIARDWLSAIERAWHDAFEKEVSPHGECEER